MLGSGAESEKSRAWTKKEAVSREDGKREKKWLHPSPRGAVARAARQATASGQATPKNSAMPVSTIFEASVDYRETTRTPVRRRAVS